ncbi:MAG: hypothetical protein KAX59_02145 [Acidovorax sp.]|nr:hypothetical protein [Acidovorax sp.]
MKIQTVPLEWVNVTWAAAEPFIVSALEHSSGDYTLAHVQSLVTSGQWLLIVASDDENKIHGAATMFFYNRPTARVAFVSTIGGRLISSDETFAQLKAIAAQNGATVLEGAARAAVARLWSRYGFKEKSILVGVKL